MRVSMAGCERYEAIFGHTKARRSNRRKAKAAKKKGPLGTPSNPRRVNLGSRPLPRHYSFIHGRRITSWGEYHQANKELRLVDVGRPVEPPKDNSPPKGGRRGRHGERNEA